MNKLYAALLVPLALLVAACGDNGVRSPDFDAVLVDILVDGPSQRAAGGPPAQFRALGHFTTPPSTQGAISTEDITTDATWTTVVPNASPGNTTPETACRNSNQSAANIATVNDVGLVQPLTQGTVYVKAAFRDHVGCKPFTVTPGSGGGGGGSVVLQQIVVHPDSQTTTPGAPTPVAYCARGFYSDAPNSEREITGTEVTWSTGNSSIATVPAAPNNRGNCISATGVSQGTTTITAHATNSQGAQLTDDALVIVNNPVLHSLLRVVPPTQSVLVNNHVEFFACGNFEPTTNDTAGPCFDHQVQGQPVGHIVPDNQLDWTILADSDPDHDVASINAAGIATGLHAGTATVNAHIAEGYGDPAPAVRNAQATLTVLPLPPCTVPFLASQGATVTVERGALCLACSVDNPDAVIDGPPTAGQASDDTPATMNVSLSALDLLGVGFLSITVHAPNGTTFPLDPAITPTEDEPGPGVGFIVGRPVNDLLLAEVLAQTSVQTLKDGDVVDTSSPPEGSDTLVVEALGAPILEPGIAADERILVALPETTGRFDAIRLTFSPAVASVLAELDVFNACPVATLPEPPETP